MGESVQTLPYRKPGMNGPGYDVCRCVYPTRTARVGEDVQTCPGGGGDRANLRVITLFPSSNVCLSCVDRRQGRDRMRPAGESWRLFDGCGRQQMPDTQAGPRYRGTGGCVGFASGEESDSSTVTTGSTGRVGRYPHGSQRAELSRPFCYL